MIAHLQRQAFHVIFYTRKKNTKFRVGQLRLVLSLSNAISVICLYVVNLVLKTSGIKQAFTPQIVSFVKPLKKFSMEPFCCTMVVVVIRIIFVKPSLRFEQDPQKTGDPILGMRHGYQIYLTVINSPAYAQYSGC